MNQEVSNGTTSLGENSEETSSRRWTLKRIVILFAGGFILFVVLLFVIALLLALFGDLDWWATRMAYFRNLALFVLAIQGILIITGLAVLVIQVARFVNLLRSEVKPITQDARASLREVRATTTFASRQGVAPLLRVQSFFVGALVFLREIFRFGRLFRRPSGTDSGGKT